MISQQEILDLCGYGFRTDYGLFLKDRTLQHAEAFHDAVAQGVPGFHPTLRIANDNSALIPRVALFDVARKVLGGDLKVIRQAVGDCVGVSGEHAAEFVQLSQILSGLRAKFEYLFAPYTWGMGRLAPDIGADQLGRQDGSMGSWQAQAALRYGFLARDARSPSGESLPDYSGAVARQWGNRPGPSQDWVGVGKQHLVKSVAPVRTVDEFNVAIKNLKPVTIASNCGYTFEMASDGYHKRKGTWGHQMLGVLADDGSQGGKECYGILNQWDDMFGQVVDFRTGDNWPKGMLRISRDDLQEMLDAQDSWAYSDLEVFEATTIDPAKFQVW